LLEEIDRIYATRSAAFKRAKISLIVPEQPLFD
jgi:hypothetical protein